MSVTKISVSEIAERKNEIAFIVFDNNTFIVVEKGGNHHQERDAQAVLWEYFEQLGIEVVEE